MAVYLIARFTIHDRGSYDQYDAAFMGVFQKFDGTLLSVDEAPAVLEGAFDFTRSVLIEFPSKAAAMAWATSPEYRAIAKHRTKGSTGEVIMVQSFDGAPPEGGEG